MKRNQGLEILLKNHKHNGEIEQHYSDRGNFAYTSGVKLLVDKGNSWILDRMGENIIKLNKAETKVNIIFTATDSDSCFYKAYKVDDNTPVFQQSMNRPLPVNQITLVYENGTLRLDHETLD